MLEEEKTPGPKDSWAHPSVCLQGGFKVTPFKGFKWKRVMKLPMSKTAKKIWKKLWAL